MLAQSTDADLKGFKPVLDNAATTLASLNTAIQTNSPEVAKLTDQAAKAIADLDKMMTNQNDNFAKTMGHLDGISQSTDVIMKQMSKKVGLLKTILNAMVGIVKWNLAGPKLFLRYNVSYGHLSA